MKFSAKHTAAILLVTAASACGSGSGDMTPRAGALPPQPEQFARGPSLAVFDTDSGVLSMGTREIGRVTDEIIEANGQARVTRNRAYDSRVAYANTNNAYAMSYGTYGGAKVSGAVFGRNDIPTLPTDGLANYSGDYAGVTTGRTGTSTQHISSLTTGDASLVVDFTNNRASGMITNRKVFVANGGPFPSTSAANIFLNNSALTSDGQFSGSASGGQFLQPNKTYTTSNSSYSGVLAGPDATEAVGGVSLTHTTGGRSWTEQGVFAVQQ